MMEKLLTALFAIPSLVEATGGRIYRGTAPRGTLLPYVVLYKQSELVEQAHNGESGFTTATVNFSVITTGDNTAAGDEIRKMIRQGLVGVPLTEGGGIQFDSESDFYEEQIDCFNYQISLTVYYNNKII